MYKFCAHRLHSIAIWTILPLLAGCDVVAKNAGPPGPEAIVRQLAQADKLECRATFDQTKINFVVSDRDVLAKLADSLKFKGPPKRRSKGAFSTLAVNEMTIVRDEEKERLTLMGGSTLLYGPDQSCQVSLESFDFFNHLKKLAEESQR